MIELTRLDGAPLWVNPDCIVTIEKPFRDERGSARVQLATGHYVQVKETVDEAVQATERD